MAGERHRHPLGNAGPDQVSHRGPAEVVTKHSEQPGRGIRLQPLLPRLPGLAREGAELGLETSRLPPLPEIVDLLAPIVTPEEAELDLLCSARLR
jgi:hypothetical protein